MLVVVIWIDDCMSENGFYYFNVRVLNWIFIILCNFGVVSVDSYLEIFFFRFSCI